MIAATLATAAPYALTFAAGFGLAWFLACLVIGGRDYRADAKSWRRATRYERALQAIAASECMAPIHNQRCDDRERCLVCEARAALEAEG